MRDMLFEIKEKKPGIEPGKVYLNRNGKCYLCKSVDGEKATMERTTDLWTLVAHGIRLYEDGTIEWAYSTGAIGKGGLKPWHRKQTSGASAFPTIWRS